MKKSLVFLLTVFFISFISAYYDFYNISPSDFLENEWIIFGGVFLLIFAMVFLALSRQFSSKKKNKMFPWMEDTESNKAIPGVIALVIAFFTASAFVKQNLISGFFGEAITAWIFLLVLIVLVMLSIPFYKALKKNIGAAPAIFIILFGVWAILKFGFDPYQYNLPYQFYDFYEFIITPVFLIVLIVIGVIASLIKKSGKR